MRQKFLAYDWFKLIVLLLLIILLIVLTFCVDMQRHPCGGTSPPKRGEQGHIGKKGPGDRYSDSKDSTPIEEKAAEEKEEESLEETDDLSGIDESEIAADDGDDGENETGDLSDDCPDALPIRIDNSGVNAKIVNADILLRSSPEVAVNIIFMMPVGTEAKIISDQPVCTAFLSGANNWWEV